MRALLLSACVMLATGCDDLFGPDEVRLTPVEATLAAGDSHVCAITTDGSPRCWGSGSAGQLGNGEYINTNTPAALAVSLNLRSIEAGNGHSCGITQERTLYCWGANAIGQVGGTELYHPVPLLVSALSDVSAVSADYDITCALAAGGRPSCFGFNEDFTPTLRASLSDAASLTDLEVSGSFVRISVGFQRVCVIAATGAALCRGNNEDGQLGFGGFPSWSGFRAVEQVPALATIQHSSDFSLPRVLGLSTGGRLFAWGGNIAVGPGGVFVNGPPEPIFPTFRFRQLAYGLDHACALDDAGAAFCWGGNDLGQLGDFSKTRRDEPTAVYGVLRFASIVAGRYFTCGLTKDGGIFCWGLNDLGQLGDGTNHERIVPTPVATSLTFRVPQ